MEHTNIERRSSSRYPLAIKCDCIFNSLLYHAVLYDLSICGIAIITTAPLKVYDEFQLNNVTFPFDNNKFNFSCSVRSIRENIVGCQFTSLTQDYILKLSKIIYLIKSNNRKTSLL